MPKEKVYGTPVGYQEPTSDVGRPKKKDPDIGKVREALNKVATAPRVEKPAPRVRGSSSATILPRKKPPAILDAEIERQSK